eukprot:TRINITY_DN4320_c0_g1_i3.p1 TRINITY_DN4320_c0_g1~~TRINITY_DN4320_c0_g1_i3.p1  ORF type:complete len:152 (+),score=33.67 TRINITY_DN4320_c0_g1_i3:171-626(+)
MEEAAVEREVKVRFLTVNDVYEVSERKGVSGGLPGLSMMVKEWKRKSKEEGIECFFTVNGDFLSASHLGEVYKGKHMIDILNELDVDFVALGNHEFDFGNAILRTRIQESNFKWINSNVFERSTSLPLTGSLYVFYLPNKLKRQDFSVQEY